MVNILKPIVQSILILLILNSSVFASEKFILPQGELKGLHLGTYMDVFEDHDKSVKIQEAINLHRQGQFQESTLDIPNYGFSSSSHWHRFVIENRSSESRSIFLESPFTLTDLIRLYYIDSKHEPVLMRGGEQTSYENRSVQSRQSIFEVIVPPGNLEFFAQVETIGALQFPLLVWTKEAFHKHNSLEYSVYGLLLGFHLAICLYNLFLYSSLKDRTYLYYVAYILANVSYQMSSQGWMQQLLAEVFDIQELSNLFMIISIDFVAITALQFSEKFLNIKNNFRSALWIFRGIKISATLNLFNSMFGSVEAATVICTIHATVTTTLLIFSGYLVNKRGYPPAKYYFIAWMFYLGGVSGNIVNLLGFMPASLFTQWGQFAGGAIEVVVLSLALGARINHSRKLNVQKIKDLNTNLESIVDERTAKIQSLLKHIPQGILSIGTDGLIESNYSAQLPLILGHEEISRKSFYDVILQHAKLSDDDKDQAWQSILASIGDDQLNFEVNQDKLPNIIQYTRQSQIKILKLTWNIDVDGNENIKHILVTMLDISSEVAAQEELDKKNQEFEIIKELVEAGSKKSTAFFTSSRLLLEESQQLLKSQTLDNDTLKIIFVNLHTIKGAARSLHIKGLANIFHLVETYYGDILRHGSILDMNRLQREFQEALLVYEQYEATNRDVLDRETDSRSIPISRDFLHENVRLLSFLEDLDHIPEDIRSTIQKNKDELTVLIFMSLEFIMTEIMDQSKKIAKDLNKTSPEIIMDIDEILISFDQEDCLRKCFIHILRNALDHGIEGSKERLEKGKKSFGQLKVSGREEGGKIIVEFSDDGRGLDIARIKEKSQSLGLYKDGANLQELANLIFEPGFSTSSSLSLVSGRGVGMGAIKQYLESINGSIDIIVGENSHQNQSCYSFITRISFPAQKAHHAPQSHHPVA